MGHVTSSQGPPASRALRRWLPVAVLGLGALAGVLLAVVLVTRPGEPVGLASPTSRSSLAATDPGTSPIASASRQPPATAEPPASSEPSPTPVPVGPAQLAWVDGPARDGEVNTVARFGDRWLAGGSAIFDGKWWATAWTSNDGRTWSNAIAIGPEPDDGGESDGWRHRIMTFATWDGDIVAFGNRWFSGSDSLAPMLWRSDDGERWEFVDTAGTVYGDEWHVPLQAMTTPAGGLAVHSLINIGFGAKAYITHDLATWESSVIVDEEPSLTAVSTAMATSPNLLIAVGWKQEPREADEPPTATAHVWTSTDALTWNEATSPDATAWLNGVAWDAVHARFVVVGTDADGLPMAWLTPDGSAWTSIALGDEPMQRMQVSAADGLVAATGVAGPLGEQPTGPTLVWSSHDGQRWWYGSVLNRPSHAVLTASPGSAVLLDNRTDVPGGRWVPLVGTLAGND